MLNLDSYTRNRIKKNPWLNQQSQLIFVYGKEKMAMLLFYQKEKEKDWRLCLKTRANIGINGLGKTKEGDGKTPIGLFELGIAFGRERAVKTKLNYSTIEPDMYWVDDPSSFSYNQLVSCCKVGKDWSSAEHLSDYPVAYQYAIEIRYNKEKVPGKGSGIFLHCTEGKPTKGCISIEKEKMKYLLEHLEKSTLIQILPFPK